MTSQPTNDSELQLYRVLQRANLLNYYDTFISQGEGEGGTIQNNQTQNIEEKACKHFLVE